MSNKDYTHIHMILDRSGSMSPLVSSVIESFNQLLSDQQKFPGKCTLTLVQFDDRAPYEILRDFQPIATVEPLTALQYTPRGSTPLWDAVGRGISELGSQLTKLSENERPARVVFVIQTDGEENASREFNSVRLKEMVEHQRNTYNWQFIFLGADQDAILQGGRIGTYQGTSVSTLGTGLSVNKVMNYTSSKIGAYRSVDPSQGAALLDFNEEERKDIIT